MFHEEETMPIYEYHCDACDCDFEEWHRHADDIQSVSCPKCKKGAHRVISNTTFVLKGSGWYVTEYGGRKANDTSSDTSKDKTLSPEAACASTNCGEKPVPAPKSEAAAAPAASV